MPSITKEALTEASKELLDFESESFDRLKLVKPLTFIETMAVRLPRRLCLAVFAESGLSAGVLGEEALNGASHREIVKAVYQFWRQLAYVVYRNERDPQKIDVVYLRTVLIKWELHFHPINENRRP